MILVFGAGTQALGTSVQGSQLRGDEIKTFTIVNRSHARAEDLMQKLRVENRASTLGSLERRSSVF